MRGGWAPGSRSNASRCAWCDLSHWRVVLALIASSPAVASTGWSPAALVDDPFLAGSISCASSSFCAAVDRNGNAYTYDGQAWSSARSIDPPTYVSGGGWAGLGAVSCASPTFCVAVDSLGKATTYDGVSWSTPAMVDSVGLGSVSCASASFCVAAGSNTVAIYDGSAWRQPESISNAEVSSVSCVSSSFCMAVDWDGDALSYDGSNWTSTATGDGNGLDSVSCTSSSFCVAVDQAGYAITYNGTAWSTPQYADPDGLVAVSCASPSFCEAAGDTDISPPTGGEVATYDGSSWSSTAVNRSGSLEFGGFAALSCVSSSFCAAVDGGAAWSYNGNGWSAHLIGSGFHAKVSCASSSFCVAVDANGHALTFDGTNWTAPADIDAPNAIESVSCPETEFCLAVDSAGQALTFDGTNWSSPRAVDPGVELTSVSCLSPSFCMAVDANGDALDYDGTSWSTPAHIERGSVALWNVSCASTSFCVATDAYAVMVYNGSSWSSPVDIASGFIDAVSCASTSFCVAVDDNGEVITYDGASWEQTADADADGYPLMSVSCPSSTYCVSVDHYGQVLTYDGHSWTMSSTIDPFAYSGSVAGPVWMTSVSCPIRSFCVAMDDEANEMTYSGPLPSNTAAPTIVGNPVQGQTLTAANGAWTDSPTSFSYQWQTCDPSGEHCAAIPGATSQTFVPSGSDNGQTLRVEEWATSPDGTGGPATSVQTAMVRPPAPAVVSPPAIVGSPWPGQILTVQPGVWMNTPTAYAYEWEDCDAGGNNCTAIPGAEGSSYVLAAADVEHTVRIQETASNSGGTSLPVDSANTPLVESNQSLPVVAPGPALASGPTPTPIAAMLRRVLAITQPGGKIGQLLKRNGYVTSFVPAGPGLLTISWYISTPRPHRGTARTVLATAKVILSALHRRSVMIKLTGPGRSTLRHAQIVTISVRGVFTPRAGNATRMTRTVTLRR